MYDKKSKSGGMSKSKSSGMMGGKKTKAMPATVA